MIDTGDMECDESQKPKTEGFSFLPQQDSEAIISFNKALIKAHGVISVLNPISGCVAGKEDANAPLKAEYREQILQAPDGKNDSCTRSDAYQWFLKSSVVYNMVVFEGYVHDLFAEAYARWTDDIFRNQKIYKDLYEELKEGLESKKAHKKRIAKGTQMSLQDMACEHMINTLNNLSVEIKQMENTLALLFFYDDKSVEHGRNDVKNGANEGDKTKHEGGVEDKKQISSLKKFPLIKMLDNSAFSTRWSIALNEDSEKQAYMVTITGEKGMQAVTHILSLFRTVRHIAAHGKIKKLILMEFPKGDNRTLEFTDGQNDEDAKEVEKYIFGIYDQIMANHLKVDYLLCVNIGRFLKTLALGLQRALGYYIYYNLEYDKNYTKVNKFWGLSKGKDGKFPMGVPFGMKKK